MISIAGLPIEEHHTEYGYGWPEINGMVYLTANDETEARELAHRAGATVFMREVFTSDWVAAPDEPMGVVSV